ncbi:hypothetical protein [Kitasatospora sp. NPDC002965]|uniref:hypothetical protein n=1 Tax=Kitasatospora sp. NPDC002965 TaxID=3154775 RepID=UPI0033B7CCEE
MLTYEDGQQQILEVDEKQHFTSARALTSEHYPSTVELGFDAARWPARSRGLTGREPGGGYAKPRPPQFPGDGGRHRQRASGTRRRIFCRPSMAGCRPSGSTIRRSAP